MAINIINNKNDIRAIFPDEDERSRSRRYNESILLIHPDKLNLKKYPIVEETAVEAFKIISAWKQNGYPGATTGRR
jgi:insecticidal toxin complex protein TccC